MSWKDLYDICKENKDDIKVLVKKWWVKWLVVPVLILIILIYVLKFLTGWIWQGVVFLGFDKDLKRYGRDVVNEKISISKCDGFHGLEGEVVLPIGYENDISKISLTAIKNGATIGSSEKCQYGLELDGIYFEQEMNRCIPDQKLSLVLSEGADEYEITPNSYTVCQKGVDVKLKSKVEL